MSEETEDVSSTTNNTVSVLDFPVKPQRGDLGRPIQLKTNHYSLNLKNPFTIYQYHVEFVNVEEKPVKDKQLIK